MLSLIQPPARHDPGSGSREGGAIRNVLTIVTMRLEWSSVSTVPVAPCEDLVSIPSDTETLSTTAETDGSLASAW